MTIPKGVSITLCTYNGKNLLHQTFKHIAAQKINVPCELILIDNASTDGTKSFADDWWATNAVDHIIYRSYSQPIPGKSYAQEMAYDKAQYNYIIVCDDDNWLAPDYLQTAYEIMEKDKRIGALGGRSEAAFEKKGPKWFSRYAHFYAVGEQATASGDISRTVGHIYGAGMVIRKSHWLELKSLGFEHILSCRKGNALSSGGDTEYCYALQLLGYKIWYDDRLKFVHFMSEGRLNLNYISRLRKAMAYSNFVINTYRFRLKNEQPKKGRQIKLKLKRHFFKRCYKRVFGSFEEKEAAKSYFRDLHLLLFSFKERKTHFDQISAWTSKIKIQ